MMIQINNPHCRALTLPMGVTGERCQAWQCRRRAAVTGQVTRTGRRWLVSAVLSR